MRGKTKVLVLILGLTVGAAVVAQTGAIDALIQKIQGLLGEKALDATPFMNLAGPGDKPVEGDLGHAFSEVDTQPEAPSTALLANIAGALPNKALPLEQGFLTSPKEPGPIGNQFSEEPKE